MCQFAETDNDKVVLKCQNEINGFCGVLLNATCQVMIPCRVIFGEKNDWRKNSQCIMGMMEAVEEMKL